MQLDHTLDATVARAHLRSATSATDEALVGRISAGEKLAMQVLFARHNLKVYRFALRHVRNQAVAEDIVSATFIEVWRHAGSFRAQSSASTWLLAIAQFKALSELRGRQEDDLDGEEAAAVEDPSDNPEEALQKKDSSVILRTCVTTLLSPKHREIIDLIYYHEKSVEQVAKIVGIPASSVKTRAFYARKQLSQLLAERGINRR